MKLEVIGNSTGAVRDGWTKRFCTHAHVVLRQSSNSWLPTHSLSSLTIILFVITFSFWLYGFHITEEEASYLVPEDESDMSMDDNSDTSSSSDGSTLGLDTTADDSDTDSADDDTNILPAFYFSSSSSLQICHIESFNNQK